MAAGGAEEEAWVDPASERGARLGAGGVAVATSNTRSSDAAGSAVAAEGACVGASKPVGGVRSEGRAGTLAPGLAIMR